MLVFSRTNFEAFAPVGVKKLIPDAHREALDGKPVNARGNGFYWVDYEVDGEEFTLYPIYTEWCEEVPCNDT